MNDVNQSAGGSDAALTSERVLYRFAPLPYQSLNADGEILVVNDAWTDLLGYEQDDVTGRCFDEFLVGDSVERFDARFPAFKSDGAVSDVEFEMRHAGGHSVVVSLDGRIEYDEDGQVHRTHCQLRDITERRERRLELRRHEAIVEESTDVATIIGSEGEITYVSPSVRRVLGYDPEDLRGEHGFDYLHPDDHESVIDAVERLQDDPEQSRTVEARFRRADGSWRWIEVGMRNFLDDGTIDGILLVTRDVTERKRRERELEQLTREYQAILDNADDAIFLIDVETTDADVEFRFERLSSSHEATSGLLTRDVKGKRPRDIFDDEVAREVVRNYRRCVDAREPVTYEETLPMPEGEIVWQTNLAPVVVDDEVTRIVGIARNVTERKKRERRLERYERLVENLPVGVYQTTAGPDGKFTLVNEGMVQMLAADSKDHLREHAVSEFYVDTEERAAFSDRLVDEGVVRDEELRIETLDGEKLWGAVTAIARRVDGEPVFDGAIQDITERKEYEQQLEMQRDNLEVLNQVLRHDIRNDLQLVTSYAELLAEHVDEEREEYVETVRESADHAVELTATARDIADVMLTTAEDRQRVGLRGVLEREIDAIRSTYPDALVSVDGSIPRERVLANDMLGSVFRNLLKNAIQHNDKSVPEVTISASKRDDSVTVRIADNGPGVPDRQKDLIFGKGEKGLDSKGTGMGLYLVRTLVDGYGGDIRVEDNDPVGAAFCVELPAAD